MITMYTVAAYTGRPDRNIVVRGVSPRFLPVRKQRRVKKVLILFEKEKQIYKILLFTFNFHRSRLLLNVYSVSNVFDTFENTSKKLFF